MNKVELLAPAGSYEAFAAALNAGADAVYMGGTRFGARAYADNFSNEDLSRAIRTAHLHGKKVYLTVNTLTRQEEMPELTDFVRGLYEKEALDGVIVQDTGVLISLSEACPGLLLHASTQMSVTTREGVLFLKRLGVSRIVPARELSLKEIRLLKQENIEIEAFIHGAMCYCYSGRCLMSSFLGGRSGNRGRCAGPCRLPYDVLGPDGREALRGKRGECYPISMRDLCVLEILPELIDAGIDSFKIEGRMKKPEYAAGVTAVYRRYIDRFYEWDRDGRPGSWEIDPADDRLLRALYLRSDLSTGYYERHNGRELLTMGKPGYSGTPDALLEQIREAYPVTPRPIPIRGLVKLSADRPAELILRTDDSSEKPVGISVQGAVCMKAKSRPLTEEEVRDRLSRTGNSPFVLIEPEVEMEQDLFLPVSSLNELRRAGLARLEEAILETKKEDTSGGMPAASVRPAPRGLCPDFIRKDGRPLRMISVTTQEQYDAALESGTADYLIPESDTIRLRQNAAAGHLMAFPAVFRERSRAQLEEAYRTLTEGQLYCGALVRTIEELEFLSGKGYTGPVAADSSCYAWNSASAELFLSQCDLLVLPAELSGRELYKTFRPLEGTFGLQVYGRIPMMVSAGCVRKTSDRCTGKEEGFYFLRDRKGEHFPVRTVCRHCYNILYNSVPLSLHRDLADHRSGRSRQPVLDLCDVRYFAFTTESGRETLEILKSFEAENPEKIITAYTAGHFRKGAE